MNKIQRVLDEAVKSGLLTWQEAVALQDAVMFTIRSPEVNRTFRHVYGESNADLLERLLGKDILDD